MSLTTIFLLLIAGILLLYFSTRTPKSAYTGFYKIYTPTGLLFIKQLEEMFDNNQSLSSEALFSLYNKNYNSNVKTIDDLEKEIGVSNYLEEENVKLSQKFIAGDYFTNLVDSLFYRWMFDSMPITSRNSEEAFNDFGINIQDNEVLYQQFKSVDFLEEKKIVIANNYGGLQYRMSLGGGMSYRMGSLKVSPITKQQFVPLDRGTMYVTNKRIIFIGVNNRVNKTLKIDDIVEVSLFRDGLLIGKSNGKKPLIVFSEYVISPFKAPNKRDHLNLFIRLLNRVILNNQDKSVI